MFSFFPYPPFFLFVITKRNPTSLQRAKERLYKKWAKREKKCSWYSAKKEEDMIEREQKCENIREPKEKNTKPSAAYRAHT